MFRKVKRLRRMWDLSRKDERAIKRLEHLTDEEMNLIPEAGDGKAMFFTEGNAKDLEEFEREQKGFKGIFGL